MLLVLRDDFYPQLARRSPALMDHLAQGRILNLTDQLTPTDLVEIITGPARSQGWNVDPVLTDRLTRDLLDQRTHRAPLTDLPLLALTLRQIWDTAATTSTAEDGGAGGGMVDNTLTAAHYDRVGGVREAFATWCDQAYRDIPAPQQVTARALVTALVHDADPALAVPVMRRRRTLTELTALVDDDQGGAVLDALTEARIVTTSHDPGTGQIVVELAHDTLIEQWDALQVWLEHDRDRRRWLDRTEDRARHWDDTGRRAGLLQDDDLAEALRRRGAGPVPDLVAAYIDAGHRRQRARTRTRHLVQTALVVLALVSVVFGLLANARNQEAIKERNQVILNQVIAEANQVRADDPSLAAQLDLVAHRMHASPDSRTRLLNSTQTALANPLTGHTGTVWSVAFSPDGKRLASGSNDNTVRLWNVADPAHPVPLGQPLTGHTNNVLSVVFSPDGKTLASRSDDGTVRLWNVADPAHPALLGQPLTGHTNCGRPRWRSARTARRWPPAASIGTVRLWNVADPAHPAPLGQPLPGHTNAVDPVAFSSDGKTLASGSLDKTVRLWDVADPAHPVPVGPLTIGHTDWVMSVAFSPDGKTLASGSLDGTVRLWNVANPAHPAPLGRLLTGHTGTVYSVAFSPDGTTLASGSLDGTAQLWNVADPAHPVAARAAPDRPHQRGHLGGVQSGRQDAGQRQQRQDRPAVERGRPSAPRPARPAPDRPHQRGHLGGVQPGRQDAGQRQRRQDRRGCGTWPTQHTRSRSANR